jgi:hypothetical protein
MPFEDHLNAPGDKGQVVLIDLKTGAEKVVAVTAGWEEQMGANINWGASDEELIFNDVDTATWTPQLVRCNPLTGKIDKTAGGVYHVSPDGRHAASASMATMRRTQIGYGVNLPEDRIRRNVGPSDDDGLFITDLATGRRKLVFTLAQAAGLMEELTPQAAGELEIYGFHSKWSPTGKRVMFSVRRFAAAGPARVDLMNNQTPGQRLEFDVFSMNPDGSDARNAIPARYWKHGGHHTHWLPDGSGFSFNLGGFGQGLRFCRVDQRGGEVTPILRDVLGSGHPTMYPDGRHILTDSYEHEKRIAFGDGTVPLRWVSLAGGGERTLVRIGARTEPQPSRALRIDAHPAWDRDWRLVVFNGVIPGQNTRRVFLADMSAVISGA